MRFRRSRKIRPGMLGDSFNHQIPSSTKGGYYESEDDSVTHRCLSRKNIPLFCRSHRSQKLSYTRSIGTTIIQGHKPHCTRSGNATDLSTVVVKYGALSKGAYDVAGTTHHQWNTGWEIYQRHAPSRVRSLTSGSTIAAHSLSRKEGIVTDEWSRFTSSYLYVCQLKLFTLN